MFKLLLIISLIFSTFTQATRIPIAADNITELRPVHHIAFADLPAELVVESGWFTMSSDYLAAVHRAGGLVIWSLDGELVDHFTLSGVDDNSAAVLDAQFGTNDNANTVAVVYTADGQTYGIAVHTVGGETSEIVVPAETGRPTRVWLDSENPYVWLEAASDDFEIGYQVVRLPLMNAPDSEPLYLPSGPEHDADSIVRIGRIPAPLAVTAAESGTVRLWDLQTGTITAEVELDALPVFGRVNETNDSGRQLTWRDQESQALHLLDFATGENRLIADIGQEYIQALMLTPSADLILAVHIGDDPVVAAWDTATNARHDLGGYWDACSRVPDMVHLSRDGTTLAIGCNAGIELWQITAE